MSLPPARAPRTAARPVSAAIFLLLPLFCCGWGAVPAQASPAASAVTASAAASPGATLDDVPVRFAIHDGFDRLVLSLPPDSKPVSSQTGSVVSIRIAGVGRIVADGLSGRRLRTITGGQGAATLQLAPGARLRIWRLDDLLVIDAFEPVAHRLPLLAAPVQGPVPGTVVRIGLAQAAAGPAAQPGPQSAASRSPHAGHPPMPVADIHHLATAPSVPPASIAAPTPQPPAPAGMAADAGQTQSQPPPPGLESVQAATLPRLVQPGEAPVTSGQGAAQLLSPGPDVPGPAIALPLGRDVAAAAFGRGGEGHVVFDVAQPIDLSALKDDPVFGSTTEQVLPDAMHLRLRLPVGAQLRLFRHGEVWAVAVLQAGAAASPLSPLSGHLEGGILKVDARAPGHVVVLDDSATGGRLLVGTQRSAGQRVASAHVTAEFVLFPTWQGVAVEPISDRLLFRARPAGFELSEAGSPPLSVVWSKHVVASWPDGRAMTRVFDLPDLPADDLNRRLGQAMRDAAVTPRSARYKPRRIVAQAMLAQGMDVEAAAVLQAAANDDPTHHDDMIAAGLSAIANWLSARAGGAPPPPLAFDPKALGGTDEAALWRALLNPASADAASQAEAVAATWPMVLAYPPGLRRPMLQPVAAILAANDQDGALAAFLAECPDAALDLARARLLQHQGKTDEALALLDRIANRPDRLARAEALEQAVELRLATHRLDAGGAADALDRQIYAWRGGDRELRLRQRVAQLRGQAGSWRAALALLRETATLFPEAQAQIRAAEIGVVTDILRGERAVKLGALDLVALADDAASLLTAADPESTLAPILVDKLLALDLPSRAEPILKRLFDVAAQGTAKAEIGIRLAGLIADRDDAVASLAVLAASSDDGLAPVLMSRRAILRARLLVKTGRPADALAALAGQHGAEVADLKATIMESGHDWAGAAAVLNTTLSEAGLSAPPDAVQRATILRVARDDSEAGDIAALHRLRATQLERMKAEPGAELFDVLTAEPVQTAADLPRSAAELASMRVLPAALAHAQPF